MYDVFRLMKAGLLFVVWLNATACIFVYRNNAYVHTSQHLELVNGDKWCFGKLYAVLNFCTVY